MNVVLNVVAILLKTFLVWLAFQIWSDVRQVKERQERQESWARRRDWEEAEQEQADHPPAP